MRPSACSGSGSAHRVAAPDKFHIQRHVVRVSAARCSAAHDLDAADLGRPRAQRKPAQCFYYCSYEEHLPVAACHCISVAAFLDIHSANLTLS